MKIKIKNWLILSLCWVVLCPAAYSLPTRDANNAVEYTSESNKTAFTTPLDRSLNRSLPFTTSMAAATVNPIEFMINGRSGGVCNETGQWPRCIYFHNAGRELGTGRNRFYYIKDDPRRFERFTWDNSYITLDRDTSWFQPAADSYDPKPYGSLRWAQTYSWSEGQRISYQTQIIGFNTSSCSYGGANYIDPNEKLYEYHPNKYWGGDIGSVDSIRILYPAGNEAHWYARNLGWVAWEQGGRIIISWNRLTNDRRTANDSCNLADWAVRFFDRTTYRKDFGDWDFCRYKATCADGETIAGMSQVPGGDARTALCRAGSTSRFTGQQTGRLDIDNNSDQRRAYRSVNGNTDWDFGYYKLECGWNEYVVGVSQNAPSCQGNSQFHGVLCARSNGLGNNCTVRPFDNRNNNPENLRITSAGDWDIGAYKGECGADEYVSGVSVNPSTRRPHAILCCKQ